jgi:hypothetical protein
VRGIGALSANNNKKVRGMLHGHSDDEESTTSTSRELPHFITALWNMVEDTSTNHLIAWTMDGKAFIVRDKDEFQAQLLPMHFKHANFSSFVRQLNTYCFTKIGEANTYQWQHSGFRRGHKYLLAQIRRRQQTVKSQKFGHDDIDQGNLVPSNDLISSMAQVCTAANQNSIAAINAVVGLEEKYEKARISNELLERRVRELEIELSLGKQVQVQMSQRVDDLSRQVQGLFAFLLSRKGNFDNFSGDQQQSNSSGIAKRITLDQQRNNASNGLIIPPKSDSNPFGEFPVEGFSFLESEISRTTAVPPTFDRSQQELFRDMFKNSPPNEHPTFSDSMYPPANSNLKLEFPLRNANSAPKSPPLEEEFQIADTSMELCNSPRFYSMDFDQQQSSPIPINQNNGANLLFDDFQAQPYEGMQYPNDSKFNRNNARGNY